MKRNLIVVIVLAVLLISGCVLTEFFAITQKPDETAEEFEERQEAAGEKVAAGAAILLGVLNVLWPPGVAIIGTAFVIIRKYKPYHDMLVGVIRAIERAAPGKADAEPVKGAIQALDNQALDTLVAEVTKVRV